MTTDAKATQISDDSRIDPLAMTAAQAARVLTAVGGPGAPTITEDVIRRHVEAGAPTTADGRINLVHYAAWLNQRLASAGGTDAKETADGD